MNYLVKPSKNPTMCNEMSPSQDEIRQLVRWRKQRYPHVTRRDFFDLTRNWSDYLADQGDTGE
jgi:hypothetical protein